MEKFGSTINDKIKKIGFLNSNLPNRISRTEFEILVNNVMQENELKKFKPTSFSSCPIN